MTSNSSKRCYVISVSKFIQGCLFCFCMYGCCQGDICRVVSIFDMNHMWQICEAMYGTGGKMKFPCFHLQMQLLCAAWAALINAARWYTAPQNGRAYLWSPLISLDNSLIWANRLISNGHIRPTVLLSAVNYCCHLSEISQDSASFEVNFCLSQQISGSSREASR